MCVSSMASCHLVRLFFFRAVQEMPPVNCRLPSENIVLSFSISRLSCVLFSFTDPFFLSPTHIILHLLLVEPYCQSLHPLSFLWQKGWEKKRSEKIREHHKEEAKWAKWESEILSAVWSGPLTCLLTNSSISQVSISVQLWLMLQLAVMYPSLHILGNTVKVIHPASISNSPCNQFSLECKTVEINEYILIQNSTWLVTRSVLVCFDSWEYKTNGFFSLEDWVALQHKLSTSHALIRVIV